MICIDSNIIIYLSQGERTHLRQWLKNKILVVSIISKIEVMGFKDITKAEKKALSHFFKLCRTIPLNQSIATKAIELRQEKRMSLGDAIIAATALSENIPILETSDILKNWC